MEKEFSLSARGKYENCTQYIHQLQTIERPMKAYRNREAFNSTELHEVRYDLSIDYLSNEANTICRFP